MAVLIPLRNDVPFYSLQIELDSATYGIELRWNGQSSAWFLTVLNADGAVVLSSMKLVINWPMGRKIPDVGMPPGALIAVDSSNKDLDATRDDLGSRVLLYYYTAADLGLA